MKRIWVRRTRSADELGGDDEWVGINVEESIALFDQLVAERAAEQFPDAKIELTEGTWGAEGFDDRRAVIDACRDIQNDILCEANWVVEA